MTEKDRQSRGTPENYPITSPGIPGTGEHTGLILTTVMELQRTVGGLINAVESLTSRSDEQGKKLDPNQSPGFQRTNRCHSRRYRDFRLRWSLCFFSQ
jgi:hypothetical protein